MKAVENPGESMTDAATAVAELRQGAILEISVLPVLTTRDEPLHPDTQEFLRRRPETTTQSGQFILPAKMPRHCVLITQTCDLQVHRTLRGRVVCQVAPIVSLDDEMRRQALAGARPNLVNVPWYENDAFIDLDLVATVDRAVVGKAKVLAQAPESHRGSFSHSLGRYWSRAAIPNDVQQAFKYLSKQVREAKNADVRRLFDEGIEAIFVIPNPAYTHDELSDLDVLVLIADDWHSTFNPAPIDQSNTNDHVALCTAITSAMNANVGLVDQSQALADAWGRWCNFHTAKINSTINENSLEVGNVTVRVSASLTYAELQASDELDFSYLSFAGE